MRGQVQCGSQLVATPHVVDAPPSLALLQCTDRLQGPAVAAAEV
jgi:hypothetical protein